MALGMEPEVRSIERPVPDRNLLKTQVRVGDKARGDVRESWTDLMFETSNEERSLEFSGNRR